MRYIFFFFNDTATTEIYTLSLHDALPIFRRDLRAGRQRRGDGRDAVNDFAVRQREEVSHAAAPFLTGGDGAGAIDVIFAREIVERRLDDLQPGAPPLGRIAAIRARRIQIVRSRR